MYRNFFISIYLEKADAPPVITHTFFIIIPPLTIFYIISQICFCFVK